jgi:hypothetical protein
MRRNQDMSGVIAVADYREYEIWRRARFTVCAVLDFTKTLSRRGGHRRLAADIDRLSVSLLETLATGYERVGGDGFLDKALESVDRLDSVLDHVSEPDSSKSGTRQRLHRELNGVRRALQRASKTK